VRALDGIDRKYNNPPEGHTSGAPISPGSICTKLTGRNMKKKKCFGSVRYANGEYAAEQPQGLPAVIVELTRWAAQNMELTFK